MDWKDEMTIWFEKEGYNDILNHHGTGQLFGYIDGLLIPIKSDAHVKSTLLKEEVKYLEMWIQETESSLMKAQMKERIEFINMELNK